MKFQTKGLDKYVRNLEAIGNPFAAEAYMKQAIKDGSDVVADATRSELSKIKVDNRNYVPIGPDSKGRNGLLQVQKDALLESFGISQIQDKNGFLNDKTGVQRGKNKLGQPHVTIARRLESGTSYMPKDPVFSRATRKSRKECIRVMQESLSKAIRDLMR